MCWRNLRKLVTTPSNWFMSERTSDQQESNFNFSEDFSKTKFSIRTGNDHMMNLNQGCFSFRFLQALGCFSYDSKGCFYIILWDILFSSQSSSSSWPPSSSLSSFLSSFSSISIMIVVNLGRFQMMEKMTTGMM